MVACPGAHTLLQVSWQTPIASRASRASWPHERPKSRAALPHVCWQAVNFFFVPPQLRVLAVNVVALVWNTYLSWAANKKVAAPAPPPPAPPVPKGKDKKK